MTHTPQQRARETLVAFDAARKVLRGLSDDVALCDFFETEWQIDTIRLALTRMGDEGMVYVPLSALHTILGATLNEDGAMKVDNVKSWMFRLDFIREQVQPLLPAAPEQKEGM